MYAKANTHDLEIGGSEQVSGNSTCVNVAAVPVANPHTWVVRMSKIDKRTSDKQMRSCACTEPEACLRNIQKCWYSPTSCRATPMVVDRLYVT